ncbi:GAK system CofD-like protein [Pseudodesulfovibrio cashew]|uniref:GAK system CofD-like protein n=1 Tax=Pseudodesulfovibrio cashew TaxID=2678688 RepID=A0A6I6JHD6_9BACT|nr:GAK system CofD-like protein [Pseudodesulfovibrio cashew]QGY41591.1 GAK system CofD-like protein [Pseudodesulfovibrio cashew]
MTNAVNRHTLELYRRAPELGPRVLFFSGGTALRHTARALTEYTHNSIHLVTPFDSGGSSAVLRKAFGMPAVGDIRNRLMALADQSVAGNPEVCELFAHRLPKQANQTELCEELDALTSGRHPLLARIPDPMRTIIRNHFKHFCKAMPKDFDLRGASLGNMVLTAGYIYGHSSMDPVLHIFTRLARVCGEVRPTVNRDLHMAVKLRDGSVVIGQHKITGKETPPLTSPVEEVWLTASLSDPTPAESVIRCKVKDLIYGADLICYPPGSFFSSVIANLLPQGVGKAVAGNPCPKVYVPSTGRDPEATGLSVADQAQLLMDHLHKSGSPTHARPLEYVIVDSRDGDYPGGLDKAALKAQGLTVIDRPLASRKEPSRLDPYRLCETLLSLTSISPPTR